MVFKLKDNAENMSGKSFGLMNGKGLWQNVKDNIFIAPTDEQLNKVDEFNKLKNSKRKPFIEKQENEDIKSYFTSLDKGKASVDGLKASLNKTTLASKAASVGMKALSVAGNMLLMWAVSATISAVVEKLGEAKKASEDAAAAIGVLNDEVKSLDDLKKSMLELRTELDKGNLSQGDAYDKRLELMKIQDTIIAKYGKEAEGIDFVTGSIKEQEQAIDNLARAEERKWKQENQSAVNDAKKYLTKKSNGKMTFDDQYNSLKQDESFDFLKSQVESLGGELKKNMQFVYSPESAIPIIPQKYHISTSIEFDGTTVDEQIQKYTTLFDILEEYNKNGDINVNSELGEISNKIKALKNETYTNHKANFDKYTEIEVNSNELYRNIYANALKAKEEYNEAILNGADDTEMSAALSKMQQVEKEFLDAGISDVGVSDYFQKFFNEFELTSKQYEFKVNIKANEDGLATDIKNALSDLNGLDDIGILNIGQIEGTEVQEAAFTSLCDIAEKYGMEIVELIPLLVELGLVQSEVATQTPITFDLTNISDNLATFNEKISEVYSSMDILDKAADEFSTTGLITADTFKSLSENNLLQYLQFSKDGLKVLTDELLDNEQAVKQKAQADLEAALFTDLLNLATTRLSDAEAEAKRLAEETGNAAETMGQQFANSVDGTLSAAMAISTFNSVNGGSSFDFKGQERQFNQLISNYNTATSAIRNMGSTTESTSNSFKRMSTSAKKASDEIKQAMSQAKSEIQSLQSMVIEMLKKDYELKKKNLDKEIKDLEDKYKIDKDNLDKLADSNKELNDSAKKALEEQYKIKKQMYDDERRAIEDQKDSFKSKIDAQLELLRLKKEEYYYDKELKSANKNISDLESDIIAISGDETLEGIAKRKDLEEQLAKAKEELEDKQFDNSIKKQEDSLNKEWDLYEEQQNNKLDLMEREWEAYERYYQYQIDALANQAELDEKNHQLELERIELENKANIDAKQKELDAIELFLSTEVGLRDEANRLIESKDKDLLNRLIEYNRLYGNGIRQEVVTAWDNAYIAMEKYGGKQFSVLGVLNSLVSQMNAFERAANNASSAYGNMLNQQSQSDSQMGRYSGKDKNYISEKLMMMAASGDTNSEEYRQLRAWYDQNKYVPNAKYAQGGVNNFTGFAQLDGSPSAVETIFNASDGKKLYDLVHNTPDLGVMMMQKAINKTSISAFNNLSAIQPRIGDINIKQGDVLIQGNMDKSTFEQFKQFMSKSAPQMADIVRSEIMKDLHIRGLGNMKEF